MSVLLGAALFTSMTDSSFASYWDRPQQKIRVNGNEYQGAVRYIGERPYVNVESFGRALGFPRRHTVKNWNLSTEATTTGSPFEMVVQAGTVKLPTTRFAGATYVDLQAACQALGIPYHRDYDGEYLEVGDAYQGEYMRGAWERWQNMHNGQYREMTRPHGVRQQHLDRHEGRINRGE